MKEVLVSLLLLFPVHSLIYQPFSRLQKEPFSPAVESFEGLKEDWILQPLDHFSKDPEAMRPPWKMRFYSNHRFYKSGGPIFIFIGGAWEITPNAILGGHTFDMAKAFNACLFYTEHRFYGKSRPTVDLTVESLQYLTSKQALADLNNFIDQQKKKLECNQSPVFLVGASYAGSLATWFNHVYPNVVNGTWASSAPLLAKRDFVEYYEVVARTIDIINDYCFEQLTDAFTEIEIEVLYTNTTSLVEKLNLCEPITYNLVDRSFFIQQMAEEVAITEQYLAPEGILELCKFMTEDPDALKGFGKFLRHRHSRNCINTYFHTAIKTVIKITWQNDTSLNMRQWIYQTCNEFGWYQTLEDSYQPFSHSVPLELFLLICKILFINKFSSATINDNIEKTNSYYGGLVPNVTRVYTTHGELDPWRVLGINSQMSDDTPTKILPFRSHCSDLDSIDTDDVHEIRDSKLLIMDLMKSWGGL